MQGDTSRITHSTESYLIDTSHVTTALTATINTPYVADIIHTLYTKWEYILPSDPIFLPKNNPNDVFRKYTLLHTVNVSAIRILRRITQRLLRIIIRQKPNSINHDININKLRNACRNARPKKLIDPTLCIFTTIPQKLGEDQTKT